METLKPCPFCGNNVRERPPDLRELDYLDLPYFLFAHVVKCAYCKTTMYGIGENMAEAREKVIAAWNRRADTGKTD